MSDRRGFRWATTGARLVGGTVAAAGFVVLVVTAVAAPWPTTAREPVSVQAAPAPADTVVSCTGGLLALGRDARDPARLTVAAAPSVTVGTPNGAAAPPETTLSGSGALSSGGTAYTAPPENGARVDVAAAASAVATDDDLRGFAASACRQPLMESWLVAGSTATGSADIVLLSNPGPVPASVELTVYGQSGPAVPPGGSDLVVPAATQIAVPLAGIALGETAPVIRVTATGAPVQAAMQSSLTRTLAPVGVDQAGPSAAASTDVVIPGVDVTVAPVSGATEPTTLLRVLSPTADTTATVTITRVGSAEPVTQPASVAIAAGVPTQVDLTGLAVGRYVVRVTAEAPLVAALWHTTGMTEGSDFAWYTPAPPVTAASVFATVAGPAPVLSLVNPGAADAAVRVVAADGSDDQTVTVAAGSSASLTLDARTVYTLDPSGGTIDAALSMSGDGALAGYPVWPSAAAVPTITVYP
ncbi:DUF5719 family protein [Microbacterium sp. 1P10UB]|uniref:DUF5719 family protein n=1 Tax=unclassified Microbacterium TaxID=2609290 RepID=UPI0039A35D93